jgi:hypothetical protein
MTQRTRNTRSIEWTTAKIELTTAIITFIAIVLDYMRGIIV